jgi:hypothetical protein
VVRAVLLLAGAVAVLSCGAPAVASAQARPDVYPDWTRERLSPFPLVPAESVNPVISWEDVNDVAAISVADPFLMRVDDVWLMFFEVYDGSLERASIAVASSEDGLAWTYDRIVLEESWHLSYPFVFRSDDQYYMLLAAEENDGVLLYHADAFPYGWSYVTTLVSGGETVDPTLLWYDNTWWMFVGGAGNSTCRLFYADTLMGPWIAHPLNPIVTGRDKSRPAGRFFVYDGDRIIRLAQKCDVSYGEAVRAFEVECLSRTDYRESEIEESPVLRAGGMRWNSMGMHQCDPWWTGDHWLVAVDGIGTEQRWSIGIYRSEESASSTLVPPESTVPFDGAVSLYPNPCRVGAPLTLTMSAIDLALPVRVSLHDAAGRCLRVLPVPIVGAQRTEIIWDGLDATGRPLVSGTYFLRVSAGGRRIIRSYTLVR